MAKNTLFDNRLRNTSSYAFDISPSLFRFHAILLYILLLKLITEISQQDLSLKSCFEDIVAVNDEVVAPELIKTESLFHVSPELEDTQVS
jgi:hypothetical protein